MERINLGYLGVALVLENVNPKLRLSLSKSAFLHGHNVIFFGIFSDRENVKMSDQSNAQLRDRDSYYGNNS